MKIDFLKISFGIMLTGMLSIEILFYKSWSPFKMLLVSYLFYIPLIIAAIAEVTRSKRIDRKEKVKWTLAFIALTLFTAFYYLFAERKNVTSQKQVN